MRNDVEGDLLGELARRCAVVDENALGLGPELVDAFLAGARHRLVGGNDHALDLGKVVQRLQSHHQLRRRAVRVGDDVLAVVAGHVLVEHMRIDLGHHQRHIAVVTPEARIIDHDAAGAADLFAIFLGDGRTCRHQGEIDAGEVEVFEVLYLEALVPKADFLALRARRGQRDDFAGRKLAFAEDVEHFAAHIARGSDDGDPITHLCQSLLPVPPRGAWRPRHVASGLSPAGDARGSAQRVFLVVLAASAIARIIRGAIVRLFSAVLNTPDSPSLEAVRRFYARLAKSQ